MAVTAETYQRFESQKVVGRDYPWATPNQTAWRKKIFMQNKTLPVAPAIRSPQNSYVELPESEHIMRRFKSIEENDDCDVILPLRVSSPNARKSLHLGNYNLNDFSSDDDDDDDEIRPLPLRVQNTEKQYNIPIDPYGASTSSAHRYQHIQRQHSSDLNEILQTNASAEHLDFSPDHAPPPPPPGYAAAVLNRLSTFTDMMRLNAEMYIKENVPRLPENFFNDEPKVQNFQRQQSSTTGGDGGSVDDGGRDEVDMPRRRKMIEGIEQEDFVAKAVAYTAWALFLFQRMVALSVFFHFYPWPCVYLCVGHYAAMLLLLFVETRFHEKIERTAFYLFLAYVYVFCILEFKIKFRKPRRWFVGYVLLVMVQNLSITLVWYYGQDWESWWFEYLFAAVMLSMLYATMCWGVYFFLLKPADKVLFQNDDDDK